MKKYQKTFQPVLDGRMRIAVPKEKVNGYKHEKINSIHIYRRGNIGYIIDTFTTAVTIKKYDYSTAQQLYITYDECHKFIDIININHDHQEHQCNK